AIDVLHRLLEQLEINVVSTIFTSDDIVPSAYPRYLGRQGMPGTPAANWAIDNCDVLLVVGDRLQLMNTSYEPVEFARQATKIMVDIDPAELFKPTLMIDIPVHCDARDFLQQLAVEKLRVKRWNVPVRPLDVASFDGDGEFVNVYRLMETLNSL